MSKLLHSRLNFIVIRALGSLIVGLTAPGLPSHAKAAEEVTSVTRDCPEHAHSRRVSLFVDLNGSYRELEKARAAACRRGEKLIHLPSERAIYHAGRAADAFEPARIAYKTYVKNCVHNLNEECDAAHRAAAASRHDAAKAIYESTISVDQYSAQSETAKVIATLDREKKVLTRFTLSGHHRIHFFGNIGGKFEYDFLFNQFGEHPAVAKELEFLGLWGCAGVTRNTVERWKEKVPSIQILAGFYESAPLGVSPASGDYLYEVETGFDALVNAESKEALQLVIDSMPAMNGLSPAMFVATKNNPKGYFFSREAAKRPGDPMIARLSPMRLPGRCEAFISRFKGSSQTLRGYWRGDQPLPVDDSESSLKMIYFDLMQNEDCLSAGMSSFSADSVAFLRFFETGVKQNFAATFANGLREAAEELKAFDMKMIPESIAEGSKTMALALIASQRKTAAEAAERMAKRKATFLGNLPWDARYQALSRQMFDDRRNLKKSIAKRLPEWRSIDDLDATIEAVDRLSEKSRGEADAFKASLLATKEYLVTNTEPRAPDGQPELDSREYAKITTERAEVRLRGDLSKLVADLATNLIQLGTLNRFGIVQLHKRYREAVALVPAFESTLPKTKDAMGKLDRYLYQLKPECMDFTEWHEYNEGEIAPPLCP